MCKAGTLQYNPPDVKPHVKRKVYSKFIHGRNFVYIREVAIESGGSQ